jgi:hypothetical protein
MPAVNSSIKIFYKTGNALNGVNGATCNSFFSAMGPARRRRYRFGRDP